MITNPKHDKLVLIFLASSKTFPVAPVYEIFSHPARSIKKSLPVLADKSIKLFYVIDIINTKWERDDLSFILVALTERLQLA